ncbi:hypothetical protein V5J35_002813 [Endozoicomonas sp. NE40]|uniref:Uncharacterized protein n=1 Tax=Endozoicomonas lisbonensis TaxID=3120522 RepID=A0ABV2SK35_9GAMM
MSTLLLQRLNRPLGAWLCNNNSMNTTNSAKPGAA